MEFKNHNQPLSTTLYHIVDNFFSNTATPMKNQSMAMRHINKPKGFDVNATMSIFGN
jgi:hypothetical protein